MPRAGYFGPFVIGDDQFEEEKEMAERGRIKFGPLVTGEDPVNVMASQVADLTIESVKAKLENNPKIARHLLVAESAREEGARVEALEEIIHAAIFIGDAVIENKAKSELKKAKSAVNAKAKESTDSDSAFTNTEPERTDDEVVDFTPNEDED